MLLWILLVESTTSTKVRLSYIMADVKYFKLGRITIAIAEDFRIAYVYQ